MPSIFSRAKAGRLVIQALEEQMGLRRNQFSCDSRLSSDLGITGDDTYELLEYLDRKCGIDFSGFKGEEWIDPEGEVNPIVVIAGMSVASLSIGYQHAMTISFHSPYLFVDLMLMITSIILSLGIFYGACILCRYSSPNTKDLTVRDLVNMVESKRWVEPSQSKK